MDVRRLQYFIAVAEEMSFSRAAERLDISQPPLSQQIKILERELGCLLFDRSNRSIRLTAPGAVLLREAKHLLARHEAAARLVAHATESGERVVSIAFINSALVGLAPAIVSWLRREMPYVQPDLVDIQSGAQADAIAQERIDIGVLRTTEKPKGYRRIDLPREPLWLVVPERHPFVERESVRFEELAHENIVLYSRHLAPAEFDNFVAQSDRRGFNLKVTTEMHSGSTMLPYVAAGLGVSLVAKLSANLSMNGVRFLPIDPPVLAAPLAILTRENNHDPVIDDVVDAMARIAEEIMRDDDPRSAEGKKR